MNSGLHRRRVGAVRPSHLMFTSGVGALIDLPNFSVLVRGIDDWTYHPVPPEPVVERRLLAAVQRLPEMRSVERLQKAPWLDGTDANPNSEAARTGVPVIPFPDWLRCTACDELAPSTSKCVLSPSVSTSRIGASSSTSNTTARRGGLGRWMVMGGSAAYFFLAAAVLASCAFAASVTTEINSAIATGLSR